jgi:penicillin G amidase
LGRGYEVGFGPSQRHVYSLVDWDESLAVIPTGESGLPASPFYCDQTALYVGGGYHPDYASRGRVEDAAKFRMTLNPVVR